jgi:DNA (cytosine-5)-methyltransferase 1
MRMLDLFSGIGGFHKGFEQAGYEFDWVGFSEIDKYASAVYRHRFPEAVELGDITAIQPGRDLPDHIDILCGGFPCQAFSVAGKRKGFDDTRGTLFFEIARLLRHYRDAESPIDYFLLENVKGLLSHDNGRTFATIYGVLSDLGYTVEFQLLNTRWWLPQNRERIYLVGYIGDRSGSKVFPIGEDGGTYNVNQTRTKSKTKLCTAITTREGGRKENNFVIVDKQSDMDLIKLKQIGTIGKDSEATRVYDTSGIARTIKNGGGMGAKTGLYEIHEDFYKGRDKRIYKDEAPTLRGDRHGLQVKAVLTPNRAEKGQKEYAPCIRAEHHNTADVHYIPERSQIRRLTPVECCRLQGFPDDWNEYGEFDGEVKPMSDTQRYKQAGNAVTVNVVQAVAERLYDILHD